MLVGSCEGVNDRRIAAEIVDGALDPDAVADRCGAGARCGECRPTIEALLVELGLAGQPAA